MKVGGNHFVDLLDLDHPVSAPHLRARTVHIGADIPVRVSNVEFTTQS